MHVGDGPPNCVPGQGIVVGVERRQRVDQDLAMVCASRRRQPGGWRGGRVEAHRIALFDEQRDQCCGGDAGHVELRRLAGAMTGTHRSTELLDSMIIMR